MYSEQKKLLFALVKEHKKEKRSKEEILKTFVNAGIMTKSGEFTKPYEALKNWKP